MDDLEKIPFLQDALKRLLLQEAPASGIYPTLIDGLRLARREEGGGAECGFEKTLVGLVVQGEKRSFMAGREYVYGSGDSIAAAVDMPISSRIAAASRDNPFLFIFLQLDRNLLASLAFEMGAPGAGEGLASTSISIAPADADLMEMFLRLLELTKKPAQIAMRAPMLLREMHYLLLIGPHGKMLRQLHTPGASNNQIVKAILWIRENYRARMHVDALAREVGMSVASLHRHFRKYTGFSPLQYQKQLRLYEAQRMMAVGRESASAAALAVGYESIAHFNRDYKRLFGEPPLRDINRRRLRKVS